MAKDGWERERDALRKLARLLTEETRGGLLEEALDHLLQATELAGGAAFAMHPALELVAERGLKGEGAEAPREAEAVKAALRHFADGVAASRKAVHVADVNHTDQLTPEGRAELVK